MSRPLMTSAARDGSRENSGPIWEGATMTLPLGRFSTKLFCPLCFCICLSRFRISTCSGTHSVPDFSYRIMLAFQLDLQQNPNSPCAGVETLKTSCFCAWPVSATGGDPTLLWVLSWTHSSFYSSRYFCLLFSFTYHLWLGTRFKLPHSSFILTIFVDVTAPSLGVCPDNNIGSNSSPDRREGRSLGVYTMEMFCAKCFVLVHFHSHSHWTCTKFFVQNFPDQGVRIWQGRFWSWSIVWLSVSKEAAQHLCPRTKAGVRNFPFDQCQKFWFHVTDTKCFLGEWGDCLAGTRSHFYIEWHSKHSHTDMFYLVWSTNAGLLEVKRFECAF